VIPKECKRLAEVDFPIAVVSKHSAREKSIRHGHPSTLHLWWARRPLAACRAMLLALLLPDPADPHCPENFKREARRILAPLPVALEPDDHGLRRAILKFIGDFSNWDLSSNQAYLGASRALVKAAHGDEPPLVVDPFAGGGSIPLEALRLGCETFASDLNPVACLILKVMLEDIPRETHRRGAEGAESLADELRRVGKEIKEKAEKELAEFYPKDPDLPAPRRGKFFIYVLKCSDGSFYIGQTEDVPRRLKEHEAGEVSWTSKHLPVEPIHWEQFDSRDAAVKREQDLKTGFGRKWLKREYEAERLAARQAGGATPIAYLWARTVRCESPNCGAEIPLMRSFWLCKKANRKRALKYKIHRRDAESTEKNIDNTLRPLRLGGEISFEIFEPKADQEVPGGTVTRAKATCLCCGAVLPPDRVRAQLSEQRGGADVIFHRGDAESAEKNKTLNSASSAPLRWERIGGARMLAVVTLRPGIQGRNYRLPTEQDYQAVWKAQNRLKAILDEWERGGKKGLCPVPDEPAPTKDTHRAVGSQIPLYGITSFGDLFTARQKVALMTFVTILKSGVAISRECKDLLAIAVGRVADATASLTQWLASGEEIKHVFSRQALPIVWDYGETNPITNASRSWNSAINSIANVVASVASAQMTVGQVQQADACQSSLPAEAVGVVFTDPPYYDAIPYSDLSDFFLVWLKRSLPGAPWLRDPFEPSNPLSPKTREAVQCEKVKDANGCPKDRSFYKNIMGKAFTECRRVLREDGIGSVVFAHKTTEGWEALLSGMIQGGWTITGSWPISTEMGSRLNAHETSALATSVHLVCRPRPEDAPVGDWADVLREISKRVGDWMERLQNEGVRGADLVFACIGPALEIYSRYSKVEDAEGKPIPLGGDPEAKEPHKRGYLAYVWETVGRIALQNILGTDDLPAASRDAAQAGARARNGAAGALEEDARLTALFLWTLQSTNGEESHRRDAENAEEEEVENDEDSASSAPPRCKGFSLVFDVARRFAQPLGIHLPDWEGRIIETQKGVVRLLSVSERARQLFGDDGADAVADLIEHDPRRDYQQLLFPELEDNPPQRRKGRRGKTKRLFNEESLRSPRLGGEKEATTLDRVHAAMLLQAGGQANALRMLIKAEQDRGPDFLRLANALSALYPKNSEEKRLLDAMLLAVPR